MEKKDFAEHKEPEIVYSRSVKAGKRIYYLDVKQARNNDLYLCITESKKKSQGEAEPPTFEKHKLFLYKEDFAHFVEGLEDVMAYVKAEMGEIAEREEWVPQAADAPVEDSADASADEQVKEDGKRRFGLFRRNK